MTEHFFIKKVLIFKFSQNLVFHLQLCWKLGTSLVIYPPGILTNSNTCCLSVQFWKLLIHSHPDNWTCVEKHLFWWLIKQWNVPRLLHNPRFNSYVFQLHGSWCKFIKGFPTANCLSRILTVRFATIEKQAPYFFLSQSKTKTSYLGFQLHLPNYHCSCLHN